MSRFGLRVHRAVCLATLILPVTTAPAGAGALVQVQFGSAMKYLANQTNPGIDPIWTAETFDDSSWANGVYGVGYERSLPGAADLLRTRVPFGTFSVYTRARFTIADVSTVFSVVLGADHDNGYVAWINGVEVARAPEIPAGGLAWNTSAASHESSHGMQPDYGSQRDITTLARPALHNGVNVLAVGVWNSGTPNSTDLVLVPYLALNGTAAVTRGPYLQIGTPTSVVVRWRTDFPTESRVRYGTDPGNLASSVDEPAVTRDHTVALTGLTPDTRYYYSVGTVSAPLTGGDPGTSFVTSPEIGTAVSTRVWVIGDSGTADSNARAVRDAYDAFAAGARTDVWLMLGDNAYPDGTDAQYQAAVFDMYPDLLRRTVLWPTLGNHDGHTADSATQSGPYYDIFTLPRKGEAGGLASGTEAYYSFDHGDIHFICLESYETDRSPGGAMLTWLRQDILATNQRWTIAFWHHPPYSKGSHDSDTEIELLEMRQNALPILEQGGVDLVLSGHSHSYERSFLIDGHYGLSRSFDASMQKDGGDGRIDGLGAYKKASSGPSPHEGAVYVVAGSSGQISGGLLNHPAMYLSLNSLGSLVLDIHGNELDAKFLDASGAWRDYFTLVKGPVSPPVAGFSAAPTTGTVPLPVQFTDLSSNAPVAWAWDFDGNGAIDSRAENPTHEYSTAGLYTVALIAYSAGGSDVSRKPDLICVTSADGLGDADGDGAADSIDVCPCVSNPGQEDSDHDGRGDACDICPRDPLDDRDADGVCGDLDNCPTIPNPGQDPEVCRQAVEGVGIDFKSSLGAGSGTVTWRTTHEVDLRGFNVVVLNPQGRRIRQNTTLIPCSACVTGAGVGYLFIIPKHRGGQGIFIEAVRSGGTTEMYGPAVRQKPSSFNAPR